MKGSSESASRQSGSSRDLTKSEIEDLREAFNIFDINKDGEWVRCT
jgi:Ca2+-binding EF-hand superfamily protein